MRYPTVTTRLVILLGKPLGHSVSPAMHNSAFAELGIDYCYLPVEVTAEDLATVFAGLKRMNVVGGNVTVPHKIRIIELLDRLDPLAQSIGAVNTIRLEQGQAVGYNTDGYGFLRSLQEVAGISPAGERFLLLGAGGAARAIAVELALAGASNITVVNRSGERGETLARLVNEKTPAQAVFVPWQGAYRVPTGTDLLINATSIGLYPDVNGAPEVDFATVTPGMVACDVIPNPPSTPFLRQAAARGARTIDGLGMLVYQGAIAFKMWTGQDASVAVMRQALAAEFGG
jgi:shikimate dehydrogenase